MDEDNTPLYYFGHGLSYTSFELKDFTADNRVSTDGVIHASCVVENTGSREGDEVVQLYFHFKDAHVTRPNKQLAGFARVHLEAGQKARVSFELNTAQLGYYNEDIEEVRLVGEKVLVAGKRAYTCGVEVARLW